MGGLTEIFLDVLGFTIGTGPVVNAEKRFDQFMKSYEFAIEAQKLKREDLRDMVQLIVGRMDMYHLVGALLLSFCVAFYGQFKLLDDEYTDSPCYISEIFLLSNVCAIGYLLFSVWLALHASIAAHALGVEYLLEVERLTLPTPENVAEMRQTTSLFRHLYQMVTDPNQEVPRALATGEHLRSMGGGALPPRAGAAASSSSSTQRQPRPFQHRETEMPEVKLASAAMSLPPLTLALDHIEHRRKFAETNRVWLQFDAYSRVCMALGINQMLQALSYFIIGPVMERRPTSAIISLIGIQFVALLLLKVDIRGQKKPVSQGLSDDSDTSGMENNDGASDSYVAATNAGDDYSYISWSDVKAVLTTYTMAPALMTLSQWLSPVIGIPKNSPVLSSIVTPCFFLHGAWLYIVRTRIGPHADNRIPVGLRSVGYLEIFQRDEAMLEDNSVKHAHSKRIRDKLTSGWTRLARMNTVERTVFTRTQDSVPWMVVGRFTAVAIFIFYAGGLIHLLHTHDAAFESTESGDYTIKRGDKKEGEGIREELARRLQGSGPGRRLHAPWPEPADLFDITRAHCNSSHVFLGNSASLYTAERLGDGNLGPLHDHGIRGVVGMWCGMNKCNALVRARGLPWQVMHWKVHGWASEAPYVVPLPEDWRLVTAVALPRSPAAPYNEKHLVAGWDGGRIVIGALELGNSSNPWSFRQRFAVHPGLPAFNTSSTNAQCARDSSSKGGSNLPRCGAESYSQVRALHLREAGGCHMLAVLSADGMLDGWDLEGGVHVGRWRTEEGHTAMCHDGDGLLVAKPSPGIKEGPLLEMMPLPPELAQCS